MTFVAESGSPHTPWRTRIGRRVVLTFLVLAFAPVCTFVILGTQATNQEFLHQARESLRNVSREVALRTVDRLLLTLDRVRAPFNALGTQAAQPLVQHWADQPNSGFDRVVLATSAPGSPTLTTNTGAPESLAHFPTLASFGDRTAHLHVEECPGSSPAVWLGTPVESECVLWARLDPSFLWRETDQDADLRLLVFAPESGVVLHDSATDDDVRPEDTIQGAFLAFMRPQFGVEWHFSVAQNAGIALADSGGFMRTMNLLVPAMLGLVFLVAVAHVRRLTRPVAELSAATDLVMDRDFSVRVAIDSGDEFETLGSAFNSMVGSLDQMVRERDKRDDELRQARDRAIEAARVESQFVQNVSHELRTPMTSIRASAEIIRDFGSEDPAACAEFIEIIVSESERLSRLIDGILDVGRLQSGTQQWSFEPCRPSEGIETAVHALRATAPGLTFEVEIEAAAAAVETLADRDALSRVWTNLVSNAIKFSSSGSTIRVRASVDHLGLLVEVEDEGPGISEADQVAIFERFRQATHDHIKAKPNGTGLGLTIAREIVQAHKGEISVQSRVGEGATFRVRIPLRSAPADSAPPPCALAGSESGES